MYQHHICYQRSRTRSSWLQIPGAVNWQVLRMVAQQTSNRSHKAPFSTVSITTSTWLQVLQNFYLRLYWKLQSTWRFLQCVPKVHKASGRCHRWCKQKLQVWRSWPWQWSSHFVELDGSKYMSIADLLQLFEPTVECLEIIITKKNWYVKAVTEASILISQITAQNSSVLSKKYVSSLDSQRHWASFCSPAQSTSS